ncbi:MAG: hypothetical protein KME47_09945 [Nodosilinea sp. WJT8-NPBG4]|jgi:hypothetical protein|nr:hypothetical protein [Nodosilinea sp. WJT8-NPBG4]
MFTSETVSIICELLSSAVSWSNVIHGSTRKVVKGVIVDESDVKTVVDLVDFQVSLTDLGHSVLITDNRCPDPL